MFLESTKDILYLVIAISIVWITVFMCWMFYYMAKILRNANQIVEEFRVKLQTLTEAIQHVKKRIEQMSDLMTLGTNGVSGLLKKVATRKAKNFINKNSEKVNKVAKAAVKKAVKAAKKQIKKTATTKKKK